MKRQNFCCLAIVLVVTMFSISNANAADLYLNAPLTSDYYQSDDSIIAQSNCSVPTGNWVWLIAANSITLQPGFRVKSGAEFGAVIGKGGRSCGTCITTGNRCS